MPLRLSRSNKSLSEPYRQYGWFHAIVSAIAVNLKGVPFRIYTGDEDNKKPVFLGGKETDDLIRLFDRPNPQMSMAKFWEAVVILWALYGDVKIIKVPRENGRRIKPDEVPFELWPENGREFSPLVKKDELGRERIVGWIHRKQGNDPVSYERHEIIDFRDFNPYNPHVGLAKWEAAEVAARSDYKASLYNEYFFDNNAMPGVVLITEGGLTPDQKQELIQSWEDRHQGVNKSHRPGILYGAKWDIKNLGQTMQEMAFQALHAIKIEELLAIYKVPKTEVSLHERLNFATAMSADRGMWTKTMKPLIGDIRDTMWSDLFKDLFGGKYWGEHDISGVEALQDDLNLKLQSARGFRDLGYPVNSINDRLSLGMPKLDWGDESLVPMGLMPVGELFLPDDDFDPDAPPPGQDPEDPKDDPKDDPEDDGKEEPGEEDEEKPEDEEKKAIRAWMTRRPKHFDEQWKRIAKKTFFPHEPRFRKRFRGYLIKLRAHQLEKLKESGIGSDQKGVRSFLTYDDLKALAEGATLEDLASEHERVRALRASIKDALFDRGDWDPELRKRHRPLYFRISQDATDQVFEEIGGNFNFDMTDPRLVDIVTRRELVLVKANDTIQRAIARQLEEGVKNGESLAELADRIRSTFNFANARSMTIARTEVGGMTNQSRHLAMTEEGIEEHQWITSRDEAVRQSHANQDGAIVVIGAPFPNGLTHPGEPGAPPGEIVNCRCVAVAAL